MSWSTDFSKMPKEGRVIVQGKGKRFPNLIDVDLIRDTSKRWVAWHPEPKPYAHPEPEPYAPPKPELPEGYRVSERKLLRRTNISGTWPEKHIATLEKSGMLWCRKVLPEEIPALAAFLQGAR